MPEASDPAPEPVRVSPLRWMLLALLVVVPTLAGLCATGFHDTRHGVYPEELDELAK